MTGQEQILALRHHLQLSLRRIAEEAGLKTVQTLYDIKKGKHGFSREVAAKICARWPEISSAWMIMGEGEMLVQPAERTTDTHAPARVMDEDRVPLLPISAFAGPINDFIGEGIRRNECELILSPIRGADLAVPISGDSMEPVLHDGSLLFIKRINERAFIPWGQTLVLDTENGAFVKDVFPGPDESNIVAHSKNERYPDMVIPFSSIHGIYRVLGCTKNYTLM